MWEYPEQFDLVVIGGGHAGCEAAAAAARMGAKTLLLTMNPDTIAKMSCNPAIGGTAKGHIVREIDALGGLMGQVIDRTGIQFRMLNATKGPAVWAPRAQADKVLYQFEMKHRLEKIPNLQIKQGVVEDFIVASDSIRGVQTKEGITYLCKSVILSSGTFMQGILHIGETSFSGGRAGDPAAKGISGALQRLGFALRKLKTGTPPRIHMRSIHLAEAEEQKGDEGIRFSFEEEPPLRLPQVSCYIVYTTAATKKMIEENVHRSPMYSGKIQGVGPRYCPSIEDKVIRFADKERHQLFLEPEGLKTQEVYVNGISTSLPFDVQYQMFKTIPALKDVEIIRPAYAIEYDCAVCGQIDSTLQTKKVQGLYFAGQINGTTGYEEAAAQGLMAGINAVRQLQHRAPVILKRSDAYIGVMIDDLITKEISEPYRMFTSRSEYRLLLRQDNADQRLTPLGHELGLISERRLNLLNKKQAVIHSTLKQLKKTYKQLNGKGYSLSKILCRPEMSYAKLQNQYSEDVPQVAEEVALQVEFDLKYEGYIKRQERDVLSLNDIESIHFPKGFDFSEVAGLSNEAKEKLSKILPDNLGQAARIDGVSPAAINILMVALSK